jgi:hypothetical protein
VNITVRDKNLRIFYLDLELNGKINSEEKFVSRETSFKKQD